MSEWSETYRNWRSERSNYPGPESFAGLVYLGLALANEAGEAAGEIKKAWRDDHAKLTSERRLKIIRELGDTLWYLDALAGELDLTLAAVADINMKKINNRRLEGERDIQD